MELASYRPPPRNCGYVELWTYHMLRYLFYGSLFNETGLKCRKGYIFIGKLLRLL